MWDTRILTQTRMYEWTVSKGTPFKQETGTNTVNVTVIILEFKFRKTLFRNSKSIYTTVATNVFFLNAICLKCQWESIKRFRPRRLPGRRAPGASSSRAPVLYCVRPAAATRCCSPGRRNVPLRCCFPSQRGRGSVRRRLGRGSDRLLSAAGRPGPAADRLGASPLLLQPAWGPDAAHPPGKALDPFAERPPESSARRSPLVPTRLRRPEEEPAPCERCGEVSSG